MAGTGTRRAAGSALGRFGVVLAVVWGAALAVAAPAAAHPVVLFTDPALDSAVTAAPTSVTLVFNEAVTVSADAISVTDARDESVPMGRATTAKEGTVVTTKVIGDLPRGVYRVAWQATGVDGHGVEGEFRFAVGTAVTGAGTTSGGQATDWAAATVRWVLLAGFALALGGLIAERITATARAENPALPEVRAWSGYGALLGLGAAVAAGALLVADIGTLATLSESGPGRVASADAAGFAAAAGLLATRYRLWALLPLAVVAVAEGTASHSNVEVPIIGAALTAVHMTVAGLWAGALPHVARATLSWRFSRPAMRWVLLSYARMAAWVFAAVVVTGTVMSVLLVPLDAVTATRYGTTLLVKLALVAAAAGFALAGRWALRRQRLRVLGRSVPAESVTLVAVLAVAAALVSTPSPGAGGQELPPPPARGVAVPAGGLAGQVGVNVVASKGQAVVRLYTPQPGNAYGARQAPEFALSGQLEPPGGPPEPVRFRSCGGGCFVAPISWRDGANVLSLRADATGWRGGTYAALIPWPTKPAGGLVKRTVTVMQELDELTVYEAGTSNTATGFPEPTVLTVDGDLFLSNEPYNAGIAPIAAVTTDPSGCARLLMGFPAVGAHAALTLDGLGRVTEETLTGPKHVFTRRFVYPGQQ